MKKFLKEKIQFKDRIFASEGITGIPALVFYAVFMVISLHVKAQLPAAICMGLILFALILNIWSVIAAKNVEILMTCSHPWVYPNQDVILRYEVKNQKMFPLFWLEVNQNGQEMDAFLPDPSYESYHESGTNETDYYRQNIAGVRPHAVVETECIWHANKRGIYEIRHVSARTGDGFGLSQRQILLPKKKLPILAVYPDYIPVNTAPFIKQNWDVISGSHGFMEDHSILKGSRIYQPGDNWKQINWRMDARGQDTQINLYERIQPGMVHLILDGESFVEAEEELERTLRVMGSLLVELFQKKMALRLTISKSRYFPACTLCTSQGNELQNLLFYLAGFRCEQTKKQDASTYTDSVFPEHPGSEGSLWFFTYTSQKLPWEFLESLPERKLQIVEVINEDEVRQSGYRVLQLMQLER